MSRTRDISRLVTTPPDIYATDSELSSGGYLTNSSASAIYATIESAGAGLKLINTTSFSAVSSASLPAATFSATHKNYRILINYVASGGGTLLARLRIAGSDNTSSVYQIQRLMSESSSTPSSYNSGNKNFWDDFGQLATVLRTVSCDLFQPFEATPTTFSSIYVGNTSGAHLTGMTGNHSSSTSFDSLTVYTSAGTITGTMSAYGYEI